MEKSASFLPLFLGYLLFYLSLFHIKLVNAFGTADGFEEWGYVQVRPKAHMFWWLYRSPQRVDNARKPWPTVLWLQGGPGASGVGMGNFQEIGPLDTDLKPRNSTWLQKADLLFVDSPVGTGYSYAEDEGALVKTDWEAATDLTTLLENLYNKNERLQRSPLYIVSESYGGKFAVTLGISIVKAIKARKLELTLGGVALGDSWISPEDYVFSWVPLLLDLSRISFIGAQKSNSLAENIRQQLATGQYGQAAETFGDLETVIVYSSSDVDFFNFLLDSQEDPLSPSTKSEISEKLTMKKRYSTYLSSKASSSHDLNDLMNGIIKKKLKIIPDGVTWLGTADLVFQFMTDDFMKPRISEVDELLSLGVNVTIYNGQVDLVCATRGTEAWLRKLKWEGMKEFDKLDRQPVYRDAGGTTKGFVKSYENLKFYWILRAGHFVAVDQPWMALNMLGEITQSPAPLYF